MPAVGSMKSKPSEPRTGLRLQGTLTPLALSALTAWAGPSSSPPPLCPCLNKAEVAPVSLGGCRVGGSDRPPCSALPPPFPPPRLSPFLLLTHGLL